MALLPDQMDRGEESNVEQYQLPGQPAAVAAVLFLGVLGPLQAGVERTNQDSGLVVMGAGVVTALVAFWLRWRRQRP